MVVHVILSPKIQRVIQSILTEKNLPESFRNELEKFSTNNDKDIDVNISGIPFETVRKCHKHITRDGMSSLYLHELLEDSDVLFPPPPKPERNPELEARLERLRAQQANREYNEMTKGVDTRRIRSRDTFADFGREMRTVKKQALAVFNSFLTVIGAFVFGYMAGYYSHQPTAFCILVGLILSTIVGLADIYFIAKSVM